MSKPNETLEIECLDFKPYENNTLIGFADLAIHKLGIKLYGCSLHQKNSHVWLNVPSIPYENKEGEKKYKHAINFMTSHDHELFKSEGITAIKLFQNKVSTQTEDNLSNIF